MSQPFVNSFNVQDNPNTTRRTPFPLPPMSYVMKYSNIAVANGTSPSPPPTPSSIYVIFGDACFKEDHIIRPLETHGQHRLYPQVYDHKKELKKLNISVIANYLELLQIISQEPGSPKRGEKIDHISTLFINMHHLLNEYRPHQARDTLREILKSQIESVKKTNDKAKEYNEKSNELLIKLKKELGDNFISHKPVSVIMKECELDGVDGLEPDAERFVQLKRKHDNGDIFENGVSKKIKKEAQEPSSGFNGKKNLIISENARDSSLWQQLFDDIE